MASKKTELERAWELSSNIVNPFLTPREDREIAQTFLEEPALFMENYETIIDKDNNLVKFKFKKIQKLLYELIQRLRKKKKPVRIIDLKSRRIGVSTFVAGYYFAIWRFTPRSRGRVVSFTNEAAEQIWNMYALMYDSLPEEMRPPVFRRKAGKMLILGNMDKKTKAPNTHFPGLMCSLLTGTARTLMLGRGEGNQMCHITEAAYYSDLAETLRSLSRTIPSRPETFSFIESTSNGMGGFFYDECMRAKSQDSEWLFIFLPSWMDEDCIDDLTIEEENHILNTLDEYESRLMKKFSIIVPGYISWRRRELSDSCHGSTTMFALENAPTCEEAFAASGESVFPQDAIRWYADNTMKPGRPGHLVVPETRRAAPYFEDKDPEKGGDLLQIWEFPDRDKAPYSIGADAAMGKRSADDQTEEDYATEAAKAGRDFCAACVFDKDMRQVAEFRTRLMDPPSFAEELAALGNFYFKAMVMPEVGSQGAGQGVQYRLKQIYDNIGLYEKLDHKQQGKKTTFIGWEVNSKAQPLSAPVLTISGWSTMGDISVGDAVHGKSGWTKVVGTYDRGIQPVYRVKFSDGVTVDASGDHLWEVVDRRGRHYIQTTDEIVFGGLRDAKGWRWRIPLLEGPVEFPACNLLVEPYTLGMLLGNGCFVNGTPRFSSCELELVSALSLPTGVSIREVPCKRVTAARDWLLTGGQRGGRRNPLTEALEALGVWNLRSVQKYIPTEYKYSSAKDRLSMLQGLCDTDGTINKVNGQVTYSTGSYRLAEDVQEIVQSLGGLSSIIPVHVNGKEYYNVSVNLPEDIMPFRLSRKRLLVESRDTRRKAIPSAHRATRFRRSIVAVDYLGYDYCKCIKVAAEDGLYVADNYVLTHNTKSVVIGNLVREVSRGAGLLKTNVAPKERLKPKMVLRSKDLLSEMSTFVTQGGSVGASYACHDDLVIACAMALVAYHQQTGRAEILRENEGIMERMRELYEDEGAEGSGYSWLEA